MIMVQRFLWGFVLSMFGAFVIANIALTQTISPLYFKQVVDEKNTIVSYLRSVKSLPSFQKDLILYKNLYGKRIEEEVFYDEQMREAKIQELEGLLQKNPQSRDTLYNLYLLYSQKGNEERALDYLQRAREIDPAL